MWTSNGELTGLETSTESLPAASSPILASRARENSCENLDTSSRLGDPYLSSTCKRHHSILENKQWRQPVSVSGLHHSQELCKTA